MKLKGVWGASLVLAALAASSCEQEETAPPPDVAPASIQTTRQEVRSTNKILILASSVNGGESSKEWLAARAAFPTYPIDVLPPDQWASKTYTEFMGYRLIIIGDAACQSGTAAIQAAIDNRNVWGAIADGVVVISAAHAGSANIPGLAENAIRFAGSRQNFTGMYISLGCAYKDAPPDTPVPLLEPFGTFKVAGMGATCADYEHMFTMFPPTLSQNTFDGALKGNDGCTTRTVFTAYPDHTFAFAAVATSNLGTPIPGQQPFFDFAKSQNYVGAPYVLTRGAAASSAGCGTPNTMPGEQCDLGEGLNGQPNNGSQQPTDTCSYSCRRNWCGDGQIDATLGEECDNGKLNGRTSDASGTLGACTSFCKIPNTSQSRPPVALCRDVTVEATNTCGMTADINNGSNDPDNDLVGCTQDLPGPYNIGQTTVTLTCTDSKNNSAACTGVVTVTDKVLPVVTLTEPVNQSVECTKNGTYTDPGYRADDLCEGQLFNIAVTGTVAMGTPNPYTLSYQATDGSGNKSAIVTRKVTVADTRAPTLTVKGTTALAQECGLAFTDQGATATDQCEGTIPPSRIVTSGSVDANAVGDYVLRYNVSDLSGHAAPEATRTVAVRDTRAPTVALNTPTSQSVECGSTFTDPGATASDLCYGALPVAVNNSTLKMGVPGNYIINYKATDPSGNTGTSLNRTVTVADLLAPTLTLTGQPNMQLECATAFNDPGATANDQCYGNLTSQIVKTGTVDNKLLNTPQTLTYNVKDPKNNAAPAVTRTVTVKDTVGPAVTVNGPLSQNVECGAAYADPGASASDACAGTLPVTVNSPANANAPGNYDVTYSATDPSGNTATSSSHRTVTVSDTLPPTLTVLGASPSTIECGSSYTDPGAQASDQCAGNLTASINKSGSVNAQLPGPYALHYTVSDGNGHSVTADRTVTVQDTQAPTVTLNGATTVPLECGDAFADPGASASDACAGPLTAVATSTPNSQVPNTYNISYTATDPSGNVGTSATTRSVVVSDTLPPTLTLNGDANMAQECGSAFTDPGAAANDKCAGTLPVTVAGGVDVTTPAPYTLTYSANDGHGHNVAADRKVTVSDTLAPTISVTGATDVTYECGSAYTDPGATASDACDGNLPVVATQSGGDTSQQGTFTITYSAKDRAGHETISPTQRTVHVNDTEAPTLALNGAATVALECADPYNDLGATASDVCFGDVSSRITKTGSVNNMAPGSYDLTYNVSDPAGQTAQAVHRTVNVSDSKKPVVTVTGESNIAVECGTSFTDPGATASDACAGTLPTVASTTANPNVPNTYTITYSATDPSGNTGVSATGRTVTVSDTLPPSIALNGQAAMGLECATAFNDPGATANDQCAGALPVSITGNVDNMTPATYELTYAATDPSSHTISVKRTVAVSDTLPPAIAVNGPLDDTFACGGTYADPGATANDACAGSVPVITTKTGDPSKPGDIIYTYSAKDPTGNTFTSPVSRTVHVNDNAPPVLALIGAGTQSLECGTPWTDPGATANDACFGDVTGSITTTGSVNPNEPASYQITYNVTDPSGQAAPPVHRIVNVSDTLAPSITVLGPLSQSVQCGSGPYADPGAAANDACAGNLTAAIVASGSVNSGAAGNYTISYSVSDPSGNTATSADVRTVTVVDDLAPTLTLLGNATQGLECGSEFNDPGATANDACAGDLTSQINKTGSVDPKVPAEYTLHYEVKDPSNHTASADRKVTVSDTLPPTLALNGPATQQVECGGEYNDPGATATDVCAGDLGANIQVSGAVNAGVVGNYDVHYNVSDTSGHAAAEVTRAVQVRDTLNPTIAVNGATDQQIECGSAYTDQGATASDQCAGNLTSAIVATQSGNPNQPGVVTVTYSVTDPSGNSFTSPVTRTLHVNDNAAPTLALNGETFQTLECGSAFVDPGATANDACVGDLTASIVRSGSVNSGVPNDYTLIYNVSDTAGNSAPSATRTVHVQDTLNPSITVLGPINATYECGSTYTDPGATATDACAGNLTSAIVATQTSVPNQPDNFVITYSVTDPSGNTTVSATQRTVKMNDNLPPSITLNGLANQTLECSPGEYNDPGATAVDACVGNVPYTVAGSVNMHVRGDYTLSYSAQDTVGNTSGTVTRNVHIIDSTGPAITLNGDVSVTVECKGTYEELGATAVDFCSPTSTVTWTSNVDTNVVGPYLVTYTAKDESGNTSSTVRNVLVVDKTAPTIALNGDNPKVSECGVPYTDPGATASDSCQGTAQVFLDFNGVDYKKEGNDYKVKYRAQDAYGNESFLERTVQITDTQGPAISLVGPEDVQIECGTPPDLGVTATDLCYGPVPVTATPSELPKAPGIYSVSYSAQDPGGHVTTVENLRHFEVVDTTIPVLTVNGSSEIYYECTGHAIGNVWQNPGATATDSCQGDLQVHQYNTGDDDGDGIPGDIDADDFGPGPTTEVEGLYYVQYLAWDDSYNIQGAILSVYVQDTLKPVLTLNPDPDTGLVNIQTQCFRPTDDPTDPDQNVEVDPDPFIDPGATGEDQCYGDVTPSVIATSTVNKFSPGVYSVSYKVRDGAFNEADQVSRSVEVIDNLNPKVPTTKTIKVFPADNLMRTVQLSECSLAWDLCDGPFDIMTKAYDLQITSNDPANDANDIVVVNNSTFQVRAKRTAANTQRVYTATFKVDDSSLNTGTGTCKVYVPVTDTEPGPTLKSSDDFMAGR